MRGLSVAAAITVAICICGASSLPAQNAGLAIVDYQVVHKQRVGPTQWYVECHATLWNGVGARTEVRATVSSRSSSVQVVPGKGALRFAPVARRSLARSLNTFAIVVDKPDQFDISQIRWTFSAAAAAPIADAGPPQTASVGSIVILDGSRSSASEGGPLQFRREIVSRPPGSSASLEQANEVAAALQLDAPGEYEIALTVSNRAGSDTAIVALSTTNSPPIADAGPGQTARIGSTVQLDGSGSSDPDGDTIYYFWRILSAPSLSRTQLMNFQTTSPSFVVDTAGTFIIELQVSDGKSASQRSTVRIDTGNSPPVANAGSPQVVTVGSIVRLQGSGSTDVDGDALQYLWTLIYRPAGSTATLSNRFAANPFFVADKPGDYVAQLVVRDALESSQPATVTVSTQTVQPPVADAGPDQTVPVGATVTLSGSGVDPNNLPLTFDWSLISKPENSTAVLANPSTPNPTFIADIPGSYVAQLIVHNQYLPSNPATVTVTTVNSRPVADPGDDRVVDVGANVVLDGSGSSDSDLDPLTYSWSLITRPATSTAALLDAESVSPSFVADLPGDYVVQLVVSDPYSSSDPATVLITADARRLTLSPNPLNLTLGASQNLTVSIGAPAGVGGLVVALNLDAAGVATMPAQVVIPEGQTAVAVTVTPLAVGSTNLTASAGGYAPDVAAVNVGGGTPSLINVPATTPLGLGEVAAFAVTLSVPAPAGGLSVSLSSGNPAIASIAPGTLTIPAGSTQAAANPQVVGQNLGTTTINASAPGYVSGVGAVEVDATINFPVSSSTIDSARTVDFALQLSGPAPAGGVSINLSSSNPNVATVPTTVQFAPGATVVQVSVTALANGAATITASAPRLAAVTLNVTVAIPVDIVLPAGLEISPSSSVPFPVTLAKPAVDATFLTLTVDNPAVATLSRTSLLINAGSTTPASHPTLQGLTPGTVTVRATATGLTPAQTTATVRYKLAFLLAETSIVAGQTESVALSLSGPAPAGGLVVTLSSTDAGVASTPAQVTIPANANAVSVSITGVSAGSATINASAPGAQAASIVANVSAQNAIQIPTGLTINLGQTVPFPVTLPNPAAGNGVTVALVSSNSSIVRISPATVFIPTGQTVPAKQPEALAVNVGFASITASAPEVASTTEQVSVGAEISFNQADYPIQIGEQAHIALALNGSVPFGEGSVSINLSSSQPEVAPVPSSVLNFHPDGSSVQIVTFRVQGIAEGRTTIRASGLNIPEVTATVTVGSPITITTAALPDGKVGTPYSFQLAATGGNYPRTWSVSGGDLPSGLSLNAASGMIEGMPAVPVASKPVTFTVIDASQPTQTSSAPLMLSVVQPTPASIEVFSGSGQTATVGEGFGQPLAALVKDAEGAPASGVLVTFNAPPSGPGGSFAGGVATAVTDPLGVATSAAFTANQVAGSYGVAATTPNAQIPAAIFQLVNAPSTPSQLEVVSGTPQSAPIDSAFAQPLAVLVRDAAGQPVQGAAVTFAAPATGPSGSFAGGQAVATTDSSGLAVSSSFTANSAAGSYTVVASTADQPGTAMFQLTNEVGPAALVEAVSETGYRAQIRKVFANRFTVVVRDAGGNPKAGVTVTFTAPTSGASGTFAGGVTTAVTDGSGAATSALFTANHVVGPYEVTAQAEGVAVPALFQAFNDPGVPVSIAVAGGASQAAAVTTAFASPLSVVVRDSDSNPVAGVTVVFSRPDTGPSGTFAGGVNTAVTNASGIATSEVFTANENAGAYVVRALFAVTGSPGTNSGGSSLSGNTSITASGAGSSPAFSPALFPLTNQAGPASVIAATGGTPQSAEVNNAFALRLVATVTDAHSNPVSGVTVTFSAPVAGASGTFAGGANSAITNASGVATSAVFTANGVAGSYTVSAGAPGVALPAFFELTNTSVGGGPAINLADNAVGKNLQKLVLISLSQPAPLGGVTLQIESDNPSVLLIASRGTDLGTGTVIRPVSAFQSLVPIYLQGLATGSVQITVTAPGYTPGGALIDVTPSGFVLSSPPHAIGEAFSVSEGVTNTPLEVQATRLDNSMNFVEVQPLRVGASALVPITNTTPSVGSVSATSINFQAADTTKTLTFDALAPGGTTIIAGVPPGYSAPAGAQNQVNANVTPAGLAAPDAIIGVNLQTTARITLNGGAPTDTTVTITSQNPSELLLSKTANGAGSTSISYVVGAGFSATPEFYLQALADTGQPTYMATAPGFSSGVGAVTLKPSGFLLNTPAGLGLDFITAVNGFPSLLSVVSALLDDSLAYVQTQQVRGGFSLDVNVVSANTAVGTITTSPVTINGGNFSSNTSFTPLSAGTTDISAAGPAPHSVPTSGASVQAEVRAPGILPLPNPTTIGNRLQRQITVSLGAVAPPGGLPVTVTSNSPDLMVAEAATDVGSNFIIVNVPAGQFGFIVYLQGFNSSGSPTYTVSAPGYTSATGTVNLAPSGIAIRGPFGYGEQLVTSLALGVQPVTVQPWVLTPGTNAPVEPMQLAGGLTAVVDLSNTNAAVGTVPASLTIQGGSDNAVGDFTPLSVGLTTIGVIQPTGFTAPNTYVALSARVN